jgi:hypothetical protein
MQNAKDRRKNTVFDEKPTKQNKKQTTQGKPKNQNFRLQPGNLCVLFFD